MFLPSGLLSNFLFSQANFQFYPSLFDTISEHAKDLIRFLDFYDKQLLKCRGRPFLLRIVNIALNIGSALISVLKEITEDQP